MISHALQLTTPSHKPSALSRSEAITCAGGCARGASTRDIHAQVSLELRAQVLVLHSAHARCCAAKPDSSGFAGKALVQSRVCGNQTQRTLSRRRVLSKKEMGHPYHSCFGAAHGEFSLNVHRCGEAHSNGRQGRRGGCRRYGQADRDDVRVPASRQRRRRPGMAMDGSTLRTLVPGPSLRDYVI